VDLKTPNRRIGQAAASSRIPSRLGRLSFDVTWVEAVLRTLRSSPRPQRGQTPFKQPTVPANSAPARTVAVNNKTASSRGSVASVAWI
jgi:hypothetical protein